jgi:flavodoxin
MNALILYDTEYGTTKQIADVVARVLQREYDVDLVRAEDYGEIQSRPDLLVAGSPTIHRQPTTAMLTALRRLPDSVLDGVAAAAFCTRYNRPQFLTGSAGLGIAKRLNRRGARIELGAESFRVKDRQGPLVPGELERAERWAEQVLYVVRPNPPHRQ